jgi:hypothetical protein
LFHEADDVVSSIWNIDDIRQNYIPCDFTLESNTSPSPFPFLMASSFCPFLMTMMVSFSSIESSLIDLLEIESINSNWCVSHPNLHLPTQAQPPSLQLCRFLYCYSCIFLIWHLPVVWLLILVFLFCPAILTFVTFSYTDSAFFLKSIATITFFKLSSFSVLLQFGHPLVLWPNLPRL